MYSTLINIYYIFIYYNLRFIYCNNDLDLIINNEQELLRNVLM